MSPVERRARATERQRRWRAANPERANAATRKWRANNVEAARAKYRKWRAAHPDVARAATKRWRAANRERTNATDRAWYAHNAQRLNEERRTEYAASVNMRRTTATTRRRERKMKLVGMLGGRCVDCGYDAHPSALEFDHVRGKIANISLMISSRSWTVILAEVAKCELVCANCHRVRTDSRR